MDETRNKSYGKGKLQRVLVLFHVGTLLILSLGFDHPVPIMGHRCHRRLRDTTTALMKWPWRFCVPFGLRVQILPLIEYQVHGCRSVVQARGSTCEEETGLGWSRQLKLLIHKSAWSCSCQRTYKALENGRGSGVR